MADFADEASRLEQLARDHAIARIRIAADAGTCAADAAASRACEDCGTQIDPARLAVVWNARLCVPCASRRERHG